MYLKIAGILIWASSRSALRLGLEHVTVEVPVEGRLGGETVNCLFCGVENVTLVGNKTLGELHVLGEPARLTAAVEASLRSYACIYMSHAHVEKPHETIDH